MNVIIFTCTIVLLLRVKGGAYYKLETTHNKNGIVNSQFKF